jgi:hypothetical protein
MTRELYEKVVLTRPLASHGLRAGDVGVIVDSHPGDATRPATYELEFYSDAGEAIATVTVPAAYVREATLGDLTGGHRFIRSSS